MGKSLIFIILSFQSLINLLQALPFTEQLIVPRQGDYHIGSRYDPLKESIGSDRGLNGGNKNNGDELINPAVRAPSSPSLLPWEDDPEIVYVTEKQPEASKASTKVTSPSTQSTTTTTTTSIPTSTVSLLPWEEDSWNLFESTVKSNSTINLITGPSTWRTPLIVTVASTPSITTTKSSSTFQLVTGSTWKTPLIVTITSPTTKHPLTASTSTTIRPTTTTYSPLPWEEDYLDNNDNQTTQAQPTLKPFEPPTTSKLSTPTRFPSPIKTSTQSVPINNNADEPILNLVPLRPIGGNNDPNWPKFPSKFPTTNKF